jgi:hypothetical protein
MAAKWVGDDDPGLPSESTPIMVAVGAAPTDLARMWVDDRGLVAVSIPGVPTIRMEAGWLIPLLRRLLDVAQDRLEADQLPRWSRPTAPLLPD